MCEPQVIRVNDSEVPISMGQQTRRTEPSTAVEEAKQWLQDMEYLYLRSFNELAVVFRTEFRNSSAFREMVIELNENMIEYKFLHKAGIIKAN